MNFDLIQEMFNIVHWLLTYLSISNLILKCSTCFCRLDLFISLVLSLLLSILKTTSKTKLGGFHVPLITAVNQETNILNFELSAYSDTSV